MAIKKINRNQLNTKVEAAKVVPTEPAVEPQVEEVNEVVETEEDVLDSAQDVDIEEEEIEEEIKEDEQPVVPKVVNKPVTKSTTKTNTNKTTKTNNTNKGGNNMNNTGAVAARRTVGRNANKSKKVVTERTIGTVYPKDLLLKDIQERLDFDMTLVDIKDVMDAVESAIMEACQVASVRFLGGIVKAQDRNALVAKAPRVDYHSYTGERKVITITGGELGQPDKFRGYPNADQTKFIANEVYNYETGEWEATNQEIDINR